MTTIVRIRRVLLALSVLLSQSVAAGPASGQSPPRGDASIPLSDLAKENCPQGLERYVPGEYYYCVGVRDLARRKFGRAREMLDDAARWGNKRADFLLGVGYFRGDAGSLDRPLGLAYLRLAAERGTPFYLAYLQAAMKQASPPEKVLAQRVLGRMWATYGDATAARRAERRYTHERADLTSQVGFEQTVCIDGLTGGQVPPLHPLKDRTVTVLCPDAQPVERVLVKLDYYADRLLEGWVGHVTVGPMQQVTPHGK